MIASSPLGCGGEDRRKRHAKDSKCQDRKWIIFPLQNVHSGKRWSPIVLFTWHFHCPRIGLHFPVPLQRTAFPVPLQRRDTSVWLALSHEMWAPHHAITSSGNVKSQDAFPTLPVHWCTGHRSPCPEALSFSIVTASSHDSGSRKDLSMWLWVVSLKRGVNVSQASMTLYFITMVPSFTCLPEGSLSSFHCQEPSVPHRDWTHKHGLLGADQQAWFRGLHLAFCSAHILLSGLQSLMAEASGMPQALPHQMFLSFSDSQIPIWRTFSG